MTLAELIKIFVDKTIENELSYIERDEDGYSCSSTAKRMAVEEAFKNLDLYIKENIEKEK